MDKIKVLIVDDHTMLRSGLRMLINAQADMEVVGEAGDVRQALAELARVGPDVVTLDLSMPGLSGVSGVERIRAAAPNVRVLVLTMHDDPAYARTALAMGAAGYVVKSAADSELLSAIRAVQRGRLFVDMKSADAFSPAAAGSVQRSGQAPIEGLSVRERAVLVDVARGHTSKEVADRLGLSVKTVESYRSRMMQKLGLKTRADLIRLAVECGLLEDHPG